MQLVSIYILFARCFSGIHARKLGNIDVHAHNIVVIFMVLNYRTTYEQDLSYKKRVEMPLLNLSETIHASWTIQSGYQGNNIYEATVDDFKRTFMQCLMYNTFFTSIASRISPTKEQLRL